MELRNRWPVTLAMLCLGWLLATSVTGLGMYMVACHAHDTTKIQLTSNKKPVHVSRCNGHNWTVGEGHFVLVLGSLLNMMQLAIMLVLLVNDRRSRSVVQDLPPDYEVLIKEETPPPTFAEAIRHHKTPSESSEKLDSTEMPSTLPFTRV